VKSRTTASFRKLFASLPTDVREQARAAYRLFSSNPHHPSLHFKRVHQTEPLYAARISRSYRAVGTLEENDTIVWFWIGPHEQYETLIYRL